MKIAIIGAGVSGLAAAWCLAKRHEVVVFERAQHLGGHAYTVDVSVGDRTFPVDLGFIVYNERNYPGFSALLRELGVETAPSEMGLAVQTRDPKRVLSGNSLACLLANGRNLFEPWFWRVASDQLRFARRAQRELRDGTLPAEESLAQFHLRQGWSRDFYRGYLRPLAAAIWSMPPEEVDSFPVRALLEFLDQHGLVTLRHRPAWRTLVGGSRRYIEAWKRRIPARFELGTPVERIRRPPGGQVELRLPHGWVTFDRLVVAVHSDQAFAMLEEPWPFERALLLAVRYRNSEVILHTDRSLLPPDPRTWASWNVQATSAPNGGVAITYLMDKLQPLPVPGPWCVTLNGSERIDPTTRIHQTQMAHPQIDTNAVAVRARWSELLPGNPIVYAGAYWGHGFHEDGFQSGLRAAQAIETSS